MTTETPEALSIVTALWRKLWNESSLVSRPVSAVALSLVRARVNQSSIGHDLAELIQQRLRLFASQHPI